MDVLYYMRWLQYMIISLDFLIAFYIYIRVGIQGYMKILFLYIPLTLLSSALRYLLEDELGAKVYYLSAYFHFIPLALFILKIPKPVLGNTRPLVFVLSWVVLLSILMFLNNYRNWALIGAFSNTGLIILCLYYYFQLFANGRPENLFSDPGFWAVTGIFLCVCISLPMLAFHYFLNSELILDKRTFRNLFSLGVVGYILMHLFFIKSFLSLRRQEL